MCNLFIWDPWRPLHSKQPLCLLMPQLLYLMMKGMLKLLFFPAIAFSSLSFHDSQMEMSFSWGSRPPNLVPGEFMTVSSPPNFRTVVPWGDRHVTIIYPHATTRRISNWLKGQQAVSVCASATRRSLFSQRLMDTLGKCDTPTAAAPRINKYRFCAVPRHIRGNDK